MKPTCPQCGVPLTGRRRRDGMRCRACALNADTWGNDANSHLPEGERIARAKQKARQYQRGQRQ